MGNQIGYDNEGIDEVVSESNVQIAQQCLIASQIGICLVLRLAFD